VLTSEKHSVKNPVLSGKFLILILTNYEGERKYNNATVESRISASESCAYIDV